MTVTRKREAIRRANRRVFLPDFPHLPERVADEIAEYDARLASGTLPPTDAADAALLDNVRRHLPEDMI